MRWLFLLLILTGCTQAPFHRTVKLDPITVHVVSDYSLFQEEDCQRSEVLGYACSDGQIWVIGTERHGEVMPDLSILGHEVLHQMRWRDKGFADPDRSP